MQRKAQLQTCQMRFSSAIATAVSAALPVVHRSPILDTRQNGVTCQNSRGSPKTEDVAAVINQLKGQGGSCPNTNGKASGNYSKPLPLPSLPPKTPVKSSNNAEQSHQLVPQTAPHRSRRGVPQSRFAAGSMTMARKRRARM